MDEAVKKIHMKDALVKATVIGALIGLIIGHCK